MGTVYRKTVTKAVPVGAEVFERKGSRFARWIAASGRVRTAPLTTGKDGGDRLVIQASTFTAKYRDGQGVVREVATGCRDETAARRVLSDLEQRAELVKAKVLTADQDAIADNAQIPFSKHVETYITRQRSRGLNKARIDATKMRLERIARDCQFSLLSELSGSKLESWLGDQADTGMSPGNRNEYRKAMVGLANWCVKSHRLVANPFLHVPMADAHSDPRRKRRAMTEDELRNLLDAARERPLLDAMTIRRGKRKGQLAANVSSETRTRLEAIGTERALIYKTLLLTGLRKRELASLTVGQLELDGAVAYAVLNPADEKSRKGSEIPLRTDLACDLRSWLQGRLRERQEIARRTGEPIPARLPASMPVFNVPDGLLQILNRDLVHAGLAKRVEGRIEKSDDRGRTIDVHALRHTFGTLLSRGGVSPRTAQAAMRHSSIDLTMNTYTDPRLLDVAGAVECLPDLPLTEPERPQQQKATGTDGTSTYVASAFAPAFAPTSDKSCLSESSAGNAGDDEPTVYKQLLELLSAAPDRTCAVQASADNTGPKVERTGVEPVTSALQRQRSPN